MINQWRIFLTETEPFSQPWALISRTHRVFKNHRIIPDAISSDSSAISTYHLRLSMESSLPLGGAVIEVMSHTECCTPTLALHHQQLVQTSISAGHAIGGVTYKLRCQVIPHPIDSIESGALILILLPVDDIWRLGGELERLNSPALVS